MDPINFPTVTVNGQQYRARMSHAAMIRLRDDVEKPINFFDAEAIKDQLASMDTMEQSLRFARAMINFPGTYQDFSESIDMSELPALVQAVTVAMSKVSPQTATPVTPGSPLAIQ